MYQPFWKWKPIEQYKIVLEQLNKLKLIFMSNVNEEDSSGQIPEKVEED